MRIEEAQIALQVAKCLNFSLAAEQLNLVNSKVTRVITNLEQEYGHAIFSRTTRKINITAYGQVFLRHAQRMVTQDENLRVELSALSQGQMGTIELGYSGNVMTDILPLVVNHALQHSPSLKITPHFAWAQEIERNLQDGTVDIGFISSVAPLSGLEYLHMADKEVFFVVPDDHVLASYNYVEFDDIAEELFVVGPYQKWRSQRMMLDSYFGRHRQPYKIAFVTDDPVSMEVMVKMGIGIGLNYELPDTPLRPGLVRLPVRDETSTIPVYAQWCLSNSNPSLQPFIQMLQDMRPSIVGYSN